MSVALLSRSEIQEIVRETADLVIAELRNELTRPPKEYLTKAELAAYWQVSPATITRRMNQGMPCEKVHNTHPRFRRTEVDEWLKRQISTNLLRQQHRERHEAVQRKTANV